MLKSAGKTDFWFVILSSAVYFFSNPQPQFFYDYTFKIAGRLLQGSIGLTEPPPTWLNEFVPDGGVWYSVFPLGSVLSMLPFALLQSAGVISAMPSGFLAAALAGGTAFFLLKIAENYPLAAEHKYFYSAAILFGTFAWTNLTFGGAWQIALGFALFGQSAAIYYSIFRRRPFLAGCYFALAFGNRTEVVLLAPIFLYFLTRNDTEESSQAISFSDGLCSIARRMRKSYKILAAFCIVPFLLGVSTLAYNFVRFESVLDFGYARIPGVLSEPWYNYGIFSIKYIPRQVYEMLFKPWEFRQSFPLPVPNGFSSSILISSPFLLLIFRRGAMCRKRKTAAFIAISAITFILWMHGNSGGWQFGYRYWIDCLPWAFLIILESARPQLSRFEKSLIAYSIAINLYATWLFHWSDILRR
ncbi:MAG: hypothetical protein C4324_08660 [Blastocatellia bacterium]